MSNSTRPSSSQLLLDTGTGKSPKNKSNLKKKLILTNPEMETRLGISFILISKKTQNVATQQHAQFLVKYATCTLKEKQPSEKSAGTINPPPTIRVKMDNQYQSPSDQSKTLLCDF